MSFHLASVAAVTLPLWWCSLFPSALLAGAIVEVVQFSPPLSFWAWVHFPYVEFYGNIQRNQFIMDKKGGTAAPPKKRWRGGKEHHPKLGEESTTTRGRGGGSSTENSSTNAKKKGERSTIPKEEEGRAPPPANAKLKR